MGLFVFDYRFETGSWKFQIFLLTLYTAENLFSDSSMSGDFPVDGQGPFPNAKHFLAPHVFTRDKISLAMVAVLLVKRSTITSYPFGPNYQLGANICPLHFLACLKNGLDCFCFFAFHSTPSNFRP